MKLKKLLNHVLRPHPAVSVLIILLSAVLLFFALSQKSTISEWIACSVYALSTYALYLAVFYALKLSGKIKPFFFRSKYVRNFFGNLTYKAQITLNVSFIVNTVYAVIKLAFGIYYRSLWFGAIAIYYIIICFTRLHLLRRIDKGEKNGLMTYRRCGIMLATINIALSVMVVQMVYQNKSFNYPGTLIYAAAGYSFYRVITAVTNIIKYRKLNNPILSASKAVNLACALVSLLSLQTAMITQFGDDELFRQSMNAITGIAVCLSIFGISIYMVYRANREIKKYEVI